MLLSADLGGTKTLLRLSDLNGRCIREQSYISQQFADFESVIQTFIKSDENISAACLAVAGPVLNEGNQQRSNITNLPWILESQSLIHATGCSKLKLINDFEAVAQGLDELTADDIITLQTGTPDAHANKAVIGAGTGLGQAFVTYSNQRKHIHPTEGGHVDFAPVNEQQIGLLQYILPTLSRVSYEQILSGQGLVNIFNYLCHTKNQHCLLAAVLDAPDPAAEISTLAQNKTEPLAVASLNMFMEIYGAQAGNLALNTLCFGGLYIAGGIATKNLTLFQNSGFLNSFLAKGKMRDLMPRFPVFVIKNPQIGLIGATSVAKEMVNIQS